MKSAQIDKYIYSTKIIGKGSFSRVYKGLDTITDEVVAIKIIEKEHVKKCVVDNLKSEVILHNDLHHENIVTLKDFLEDDENFYLILEYCAGGDLSRLIKKGKLSEDKAKDISKQLVNALRYLSKKNIFHRDLKPQNILLTEDHNIKITDFNFARTLYETDLAQTLCGTPLYMAPEIIAAESYTTKADLWSIGIILYEMIYGEHPYGKTFTILDLAKKIKTKEIVYPKIVSNDCISLIKGLLNVNPSERINWDQLFSHPWLCTDEPQYLIADCDNFWESVNLTTISPRTALTQPIKLNNQKGINVVDNYIPLGTTPPQYTRSEPIYTHTQLQYKFGSAPEHYTITDKLWKYMSGSVKMLKGAVDYLATSTKSLK